MIDSEKMIKGVIDPEETIPPQQSSNIEGSREVQVGQHCIFLQLFFFSAFLNFFILGFVTSEGHGRVNIVQCC